MLMKDSRKTSILRKTSAIVANKLDVEVFLACSGRTYVVRGAGPTKRPYATVLTQELIVVAAVAFGASDGPAAAAVLIFFGASASAARAFVNGRYGARRHYGIAPIAFGRKW